MHGGLPPDVERRRGVRAGRGTSGAGRAGGGAHGRRRRDQGTRRARGAGALAAGLLLLQLRVALCAAAAPAVEQPAAYHARLLQDLAAGTATNGTEAKASSEFEVMGSDAERGDHFGASVDVSGDTVVVGAPRKHQTVHEVQTIRTSASSSTYVKEVQVIRTLSDHRSEVQRFHSTADANTTLGGSFTVALGPHRSRPLDAGITGELLAHYLSKDLRVGKVAAARAPHTSCACANAHVWTITFKDLQGRAPDLTLDATRLSGAGAAFSAVAVLQRSPFLDGTFQLRSGNLSSRPLGAAAEVVDVRRALEQDLHFEVEAVARSGPDAQGGYQWHVTFAPVGERYEMPLLRSDAASLGGLNGRVVHARPRKGRSPLLGSFRVRWRNSSYTPWLRYDASASDLESALERLETIDAVRVSRTPPTAFHGHDWTVTFERVRKQTAYGPEDDDMGDLEPLDVDGSGLCGSDATATVHHVDFSADDLFPHVAKRAGSYGTGAGKVYTAVRSGNQWVQDAALHGSDTDAQDNFGRDVSVSGPRVAVGAPTAEAYGKDEVQSLRCRADAGSFYLSFRGFRVRVAFDVSAEQLEAQIRGEWGTLEGLHALPVVSVAGWGGGPFCAADTTALITFREPKRGGSAGDIELLTTDRGTLTFGGEASAAVLQAGKVTDGEYLEIAGQGAVYVFRRSSGAWSQEQKLSLAAAGAGGDRFGEAVALDPAGTRLLVGAPGRNGASGQAFLYEYGTEWTLLQTLGATDGRASRTPAEQFGLSVAMSSEDVVVGAPHFDGGEGAVFVYRQLDSNVRLLLQQVVQAPSPQTAALFGFSVAVDSSAKTFAVGSPAEDARTAYRTATAPAAARVDAGAVYVYLRDQSRFALQEKLVPTNVRRLDRFGHSVDVEGDTVLATSLERFRGELKPRRPVMQIVTRCAGCRTPPGYAFKLSWKVDSGGGALERTVRHDASAAELADLLEGTFESGDVVVTRSAASAANSGHRWTVTFAEGDAATPLLRAEPHPLFADVLRVEVGWVNKPPPKVRGLARLFSRSGAAWTEQAFLFPSTKQGQDLFGASAALGDRFAVVGAPNRDTLASGRNAGGIFVFSLSFMDFAFSKSAYAVAEGATLAVPVHRAAAPSSEVVTVKTLDRNAADGYQRYVADLYGVDVDALPFGETAIDGLHAGDAHGLWLSDAPADAPRPWVGGMFDYRGISDYVALDADLAFAAGEASRAVNLTATNDFINEAPEESVTLMIAPRGVFPSPLGKLVARVTIDGASDGGVGTTTYHEKLIPDGLAPGDALGAAVGISHAAGVAIVGADLSSAGAGVPRTGKAYAYVRATGVWDLSAELSAAAAPPPHSSARFGAAVAVDHNARGDTTALVGAPGAAAVHAFLYDAAAGSWTQQAVLRAPDAPGRTADAHFGDAKAVAMDNEVAVVGAHGVEKVYVFLRRRDGGTYTWQPGRAVVSSDRASDRVLGKERLRRQRFGSAVSVSGRTFAVGAPHGGYGSRGAHPAGAGAEEETQATDSSFGRGKVYVFASDAPAGAVVLLGDAALTAGTFTLRVEHCGAVATTRPIAHSASGADLRAALVALDVVDEARAFRESASVAGGQRVTWSVQFPSEWGAPPKLHPQWHGHGCAACAPFSASWSAADAQQMAYAAEASSGAWAEQAALQAGERAAGDHFGGAVSLDGDQLLVGACRSGAAAGTDWGFETGDLAGWTRTGDAFDHQPTFGDNARHRSVYHGFGDDRTRDAAQPSRLRGRYYVGTFERRPSAAYAAGGAQGDTPVGTLTSQPFVVLGDRVSLLVGGGCDHLKQYVELLVDGGSVARATGRCRETMEEVVWQVGAFRNRAAQVRIVDASSGRWGHINVDHISFSWDASAATPLAGAAYAFLRHAPGAAAPCAGAEGCRWQQQAKLLPSDRRGRLLFGYSVSVDDGSGVAAVGAPGADVVGMYHEMPTPHPHRNLAPAAFPLPPSAERLLQAQRTKAPVDTALLAVQSAPRRPPPPPPRAWHAGGAVYLYDRNASPPRWGAKETARLAAPDAAAFDGLGSALQLSGPALVVGAPGQDAGAANGGAAYVLDARVVRVAFAEREYPALEGRGVARVAVSRPSAFAAEEQTVEYATSDVTARGVGAARFDACLRLPARERDASCGDYEHTAGQLTLAPGQATGAFTVRIMDDDCREHHLEYVQLSLSLPGGAAVASEHHAALLRIDDDDFGGAACAA